MAHLPQEDALDPAGFQGLIARHCQLLIRLLQLPGAFLHASIKLLVESAQVIVQVMDLLFGLLPLRDVADNAGVDALAASGCITHRQLKWKCAAILAPAGHLLSAVAEL